MKESNKNEKAREKNNQTGVENPQGKTAKELMDRHVGDEDDIITNDEFKNLNVQADSNADIANEELEIENKEDRPKDEDKDKKIATPWDVIK